MVRIKLSEKNFGSFVKAVRVVDQQRQAEMHADGFVPPTFKECLDAEKRLKGQTVDNQPESRLVRITARFQLKK